MDNLIALLVGGLVSFLLEFIPGVKEWWAEFEYKRLALLALFLLAPFAVYGLSCNALDFESVVCPEDAFTSFGFYYRALVTGFVAFMSSQGTFLLKTKELRD